MVFYYDSYGDVECDNCPRSFGSEHAACQHMNALDHWAERFECQGCDEDFFNEDQCDEHMDDYDHWRPQHECEACTSRFWTPQDARRHMDNRQHWRNHWCNDCQRGFQNDNNLRMHRTSKEHRRNAAEAFGIQCRFCKRDFTSATGVTHHLESGSCLNAPNLNRETIYKSVRRLDAHGAITHKQLTWHEESNSTFTASGNSWNGSFWECYLCHGEFRSLTALNQHLNSARHKQKIYHCVNRKCAREFTALAGLFNHLESESCGATRFENVQRNVQGILSGKKLIGF